MKSLSIAILSAAALLCTWAGPANALPVKMDVIWGGSQGTVVFIHGKANCSNSSGDKFDSRCGNDPTGYWLNSTDDGGDGHDFMDEATARVQSDGSWTFWEAI
ncbi:MAG TPA: hypothetical protein VML75_07910, partial [Kofleriaceae bacterium]|nr:hypothetical protein [Kofleriaceae bacterium]